MAITQISRDTLSEVIDIVRMVSSDTLATVAGSTYLTAQVGNLTALNNGVWNWLAGDVVLCYASDGAAFFTLSADLSHMVQLPAGSGTVTLPVVSNDFTVFDGTLGGLKDAGYSPSDATKTKVVMAGSAVVAGHMALFTDTAGTVDDTAQTAINNGSIQAGASGTAGNLTSYPSVATSGSLIVAAVTNATGNFNTTVSNANAVAQSQVVTIPDGGNATSNFIISNFSGNQSIATGGIAVLGGVIQAGSPGHTGSVALFPTTAANGSLVLSAANAGANFNTTVANGSMAQSTTYTIPDIGASTGGVVVSTAAVRMKSVAGAAAAGGAAAQSFTDAFCTSGSNVIGNWNTQANAASVLKIVPGNGSFVVTSSADAGVGTFNYVIMK